jgi:outer membrane receptor for monomeric catechols
MRKSFTLTILSAALTLAGCGSADDASTEASADTVEMPADSALEPVADAPLADPSATATDAPEPAVPDAAATEVGDAAAAVAGKALDAAGEGEDAPE